MYQFVSYAVNDIFHASAKWIWLFHIPLRPLATHLARGHDPGCATVSVRPGYDMGVHATDADLCAICGRQMTDRPARIVSQLDSLTVRWSSAHIARAPVYIRCSQWPRPRVPSRTPPLRGLCLQSELGHAVSDYVRSAMCIPLSSTDGLSSPIGLPRGPSVPNGRVPIQYVADYYRGALHSSLTGVHQA